MKDCQPHRGFLDDWDNPLTDTGELYLPGNRFCNHRDCVNPEHIEGLTDQQAFEALKANPPVMRRGNRGGPKHRMLRMYAAALYAEVVEIGKQPAKGLPECSVSNCQRKTKARNLCPNHWQMFRHHAPEELKPRANPSLLDFPVLPPPTGRTERWKNQSQNNCLMTNCHRKAHCRSLCATHYQTYKRLTKRQAA